MCVFKAQNGVFVHSESAPTKHHFVADDET